MAMEISNVSFDPQVLGYPLPDIKPVQPAKAEPTALPLESEVDMQSALLDLSQVSLMFNRRLQFSVNTKLDQVVVKVIDEETDTVIKEIPPRELQLVHERIREAIGILFDEKI